VISLRPKWIAKEIAELLASLKLSYSREVCSDAAVQLLGNSLALTGGKAKRLREEIR